MAKTLAEALEESKSQNVYGKWNPAYVDSHVVDPDNLPDWIEAKKPKPEPTTLERIGNTVNEVSGAIVDAFSDKTEEATEQAQQEYSDYQNQTYEQPVGLSGVVESVKNTSLNDIGSAISDAANSRAEEYKPELEDFQNPVQAPQSLDDHWLYNAPAKAGDWFLHTGLLGNTTGEQVKQDLAFGVDFIKSTELYNNFNFMWGTPEKNRISEELGRAYGVDSSIFFNDRDAYIKGAKLLAQFKIDTRVASDVDRDDPETFKAYLKEYYPSILNSTPDTFEDKLKNAEDVQQVTDIFKLPGLVYDLYANEAERNKIYRNAYFDRRYLTDEEMERAQELTKHLNELNKKMPQLTEHPLYGVLTQTAVQVAGMGTDSAVGAAIGGVAGLTVLGATGNTALARTAAGYGFKYGSMAGMFLRQVGDKYIEYLSYQNQDDSRTLSPDMAALYATVETGIETGIEFYNFDDVMRTLGGKDRAAIQEIVQRNHGNAEAIRGGLKAYLETAMKSWAPRAKEEVLEEAYQSATGDIVHNAIVAMHPETKEQYVSLGEIAANSADAMVQAVPSVVGMMIGGDIISNIRQVRSMASIYNLHKELTEEEINNAELSSILKDVQENQKTSKLAKENPRAYMQVLKAEADKAGIPNVYVDTEMVMGQPGGREVLEKLGEQSGYTREQVNATIQAGGSLEVPTAVYCRIALPSEIGDKVIDMTTSSPSVNSQARIKATVERVTRMAMNLAERDEKEVSDIIPTIVENNFHTDEERKLATEIISSDPSHIDKAYKEAVKKTKQEYNDLINGVLETEEADSYTNVGAKVVQNENLYDGQILTTNKVQQREKFWTDYFGQKTPTQTQKRQYAYDVLTGEYKGGPRSLASVYDMAMKNGDTETAAGIKDEMRANKERLDGLQHNLDVLKGMADKLGKIPNIETTITRGLTPEGYRVYQSVNNLLSSSPNAKVKQQARQGAVIFARECESLAREMTAQGKKTTAEDVARMLDIDASAHEYTTNASHIAPSDGTRGNRLEQAMFDVRSIGINSVSALIDKINERKNSGKPENKIKLTTASGITFSEERVVHAQTEHALTKEDFDDIQTNIKKLNNPALSGWKKGEYVGQYGGRAVLARVDGKLHTYVVVLEFANNGTVWFNTAYTFKSKENADKKIEEERSAVLSPKGAVSNGSHSSSIASIQKEFGIVKKEKTKNSKATNTFYQAHGDAPKTGKAITLDYFHNTEKAPKIPGDEFAQSIEPTGEYMGEDTTNEKYPIPGFEYGTISFSNPLVVDFKSTGHGGWKTDLSNRFGGKKKKALTSAIKKAGYDAIITVDEKGNIREVVNIGGKKDNVSYYQTTWHGSPNDFDSFSLDHVGEGEGAQVHGWGLYFADNRKVSEGYQHMRDDGDSVKVNFNGEQYTIDDNVGVVDSKGNVVPDDTPLYEVVLYSSPVSTKRNLLEYFKNKADTAKRKGFEEDEKTARDAYKLLSGGVYSVEKASSGSKLYEVDIPETKDMLDEEQHFHKMEKSIQKRLKDAYNSLNEEQKNTFTEKILPPDGANSNTEKRENIFSTMGKQGEGTEYTGRAIYDAFTAALGTPKQTSELLNQHGIKGITYNGKRDGRCFVVFDDNAISIVEKYNQQRARIQGQTSFPNGKPLISLFEAADQSTFMHETAHWYLDTMRKLALNPKATRQFTEDFYTLQQWFGNEKFDAEISTAQHEKFARGFEAYLRNGKAPAPQLKSVFNRFKSWLVRLYRDFRQLGGKPPEEIMKVMDRMLATQDEIDLATKEQMVDDFKKAGGMKIMTGTNMRTWERWYNKVKTDAAEKVMKKAMADINEADNRDINEAIATQRARVTEEMKRDTFWIADEAYRMLKDPSILTTFNLTPEEYQEELKKRGGSFEAALNAQMEGFEKETRDSAMSGEEIAAEAKKAVQTSEYQEYLHALEYEALAAKAREYLAVKDEQARIAQEKADKETARENAEREANARREQKIADRLRTQEEERNAEVKEAKAETAGMKKGMRIVRDSVLGTVNERRTAARAALAKIPISQSTNVALWARKLGQKQQAAYTFMTRGEWDKAAHAKQEQLLYAAMLTEAGRLKKQIDKQVGVISKRSQTLQRGSERMPAQERYWYQHLAYVLGLSRGDAVPPAHGIKSLSKLFGDTLGKNSEGIPEVAVPQWLEGLANQSGRVGMEKLSPNGWNTVNNILKALYHVGMDRDKLLVVSAEGVNPTISETALKLAENAIEHVGFHNKEDVYSENRTTDKAKQNIRGAREIIGSMFKKLLQPITILQRMDGYEGKVGRNRAGIAIKTLYDSVQKATNAELLLMADFHDGLVDAFGKYTNEELDDLRNKRIYRFGDKILTKENIMAMALTSGTESGYKRVLDNTDIGREFNSLTERETVLASAVQEAFTNLDERDWNTVTKVWKLMSKHYADESGVKERTTGIPLGKLPHRAFSVKGKDGKQYSLSGGYYPVAYDSKQSLKANDLETQDALRSMAPGALRMAQGKGFTKSRAKTVTGRPLLLTFDTISRKGGEMMHYIAMRETALDVSRIINNGTFADAVTKTLGMQEYQILRDWASDIWQPRQESSADWARFVRAMRSHTTGAILAYRTSTMLLNASNASLMMEQMGTANFVAAIEDFYSDPKENWQFINRASPFMAQRSERMDTNLREAMEKSQLEVKGAFSKNPAKAAIQKVNSAIQENGFKLIGLTDNMFAYPLWMGEYKRTLNEELRAGKTSAVAQEKAVSAGDRAVIRVIGSGEIKDLSPLQKGGEFVKILTMFYTFQNALYNQLANKYYAGKQAAEKAGYTGMRRFVSPEFIAPMAHHLLFGVMLGAAVEMAVRGAMDAVSGGDKDKDKDASYWLRKYAETATGNTAATVPVLRGLWRPASNSIFWPDEPFAFQKDSVKITSAFDPVVQAGNAISTISGAFYGKSNAADVVREGGRFLNRVTGSPDMLTDGIANAMQYFSNPENERDFWLFLGTTLMDKKYPKAKKKKKGGKNAAGKKKKKGVK